MSDGTDAPLQPTMSVQPRTWHGTSYAWRFGRHVTARRVDQLLRTRALGRLPMAWRARFDSMGLPASVVSSTLAGIRALPQWSEAWTATAQHFLGEARRAEREQVEENGALATRHAALCYQIASWFAFDDPRVARTCRASAVSLFSRTVPATLPDTRRVLIPWRAQSLPGYLTVPKTGSDLDQRPLVVLLNGVTTTKEELILWRHAYIERGMAVLALDWPGTGEAIEHGPSPDHDDFTDGLIDLARHDRELDPDRIALVGLSLGGAMAIRAAALDRRIAAVVAVTPPFDARPWSRAAPPLPSQQVGLWGTTDAHGAERAEGFALEPVLAKLKSPMLVFGGGRDFIVPPSEAVRLAAAHGEAATLVWFENGGHGLYDVLDQWTADCAAWLEAVFSSGQSPVVHPASTQVDTTHEDAGTWQDAWDKTGPVAENNTPGESVNRPDALP
ncbi:MAG: alpha/beta hydrolase family protein [Thermomicrobiales bacterium]